MIKFISYFENDNKSKNGIVVNNLIYDISKFYSDSLRRDRSGSNSGRMGSEGGVVWRSVWLEV